MTAEHLMASPGWKRNFLLNVFIHERHCVIDSSQIKYIAEPYNADIPSAEIHLKDKDKTVIPVSLSLRELHDRLYSHNAKNMNVIDLCDATKPRGYKMPDGSIFCGKVQFENTKQRFLTRTFNVFAAPEDLPGGVKSYADTVKALAELKNWHGHDGISVENRQKLFSQLSDGSYSGQWAFPFEFDHDCFLDRYKRLLRNDWAAQGNEGNDAYFFLSNKALSIAENRYSHELHQCDQARCRPVRLVEIPRKVP